MALRCILLTAILCFSCFVTFGQGGKEGASADGKRKLSKTEVRFMASNMDSIRRNLNRMIRFEKELRQKNYYLNEKTALVDELISIIKGLQQSLEVVDVTASDIKNIFGKAAFKSATHRTYEIETYKSNCPFIQITVALKNQNVSRIDYQVTDCQRWK